MNKDKPVTAVCKSCGKRFRTEGFEREIKDCCWTCNLVHLNLSLVISALIGKHGHKPVKYMLTQVNTPKLSDNLATEVWGVTLADTDVNTSSFGHKEPGA